MSLSLNFVPSVSGGTAFTTGAVNVSANVMLANASARNSTILCSFYLPYPVSVLSSIQYHTGNASDATANLYDLGIYGPGCLNGATNVPLVCHTGPLPGTTLIPTSGTDFSTPLLGAPVSVSMVPGWYAVAVTSNVSSSPFRLSGSSVFIHDIMFTINSSPGGSTGVTTGATLNPTITAPALVWARNQVPAVSGF